MRRVPPPQADRWRPEPAAPRAPGERPLPLYGPLGRSSPDATLADLARAGAVSAADADLLAVRVAARASVLVVAAAGGVGKSTLLRALLHAWPATDRRVFLRGAYEDFRWGRDPGLDPGATVMVADEISGHLPGYLWGPAVAETLAWRGRGAALLATAHADAPADVVRLFSGFPLRLPTTAVTAFDLVVRLGPSGQRSPGGPRWHRVSAIWAPTAEPGGGVSFRVVSRDGAPVADRSRPTG